MNTPWEEGVLYSVPMAREEEIDKRVVREIVYLLSGWSEDAAQSVQNLNRLWVAEKDLAYCNAYGHFPVSGTFPKRVGKVMFKCIGKGYSQHEVWKKVLDVLSQAKPVCVHCIMRFTQRFDWRDGDYGDVGSCYWSSNYNARNMMQHARSWAVLLYSGQVTIGNQVVEHDGNKYYGRARAWIIPVPWRTYKETGVTDGFVLFNGKARDMSLSEPTTDIAKIVSTHFGLTSTKTRMLNHGYRCDTLYTDGYEVVFTDGEPTYDMSRVDINLPQHAYDMVKEYTRNSYY